MPLVIDADALNLIGADAGLREACRARRGPTVITPHPAEAARLSRQSTSAIQNDRIAAALTLAQRYQAITVLKGVGSIVATPEGSFEINTSGNPGSPAPGWDVLSGAGRVDRPGRTALCWHSRRCSSTG
jgi:NAD(P)H-hydrate repair Nnr-like enzyme with NAD(P)H-hydrate dehydratase domain